MHVFWIDILLLLIHSVSQVDASMLSLSPASDERQAKRAKGQGAARQIPGFEVSTVINLSRNGHDNIEESDHGSRDPKSTN